MINYIFPRLCSLCNATIKAKRLLCTNCLSSIKPVDTPLFFKKNIACHSAYPYSNYIQTLIKELKFKQKLAHSHTLGMLVKNQMQLHYKNMPKLIIPVPLHKKRLQERGFNQALEVAKVIRSQLDISIDKHSLIRSKATAPQAKLSAHARKANTRNAFTLKKAMHCEHVILFDDVITTGETIYSCYQVLKKSGIKQIDVWCIARPIA